MSISNTTLYALTNSYTGPNLPLIVDPTSSNSGSDYSLLAATPSDSTTLLKWRFLTAQDPSKYNICTTYNGQPFCLDGFHLAAAGYYTGQQWVLLPEAGGYYRLSNDYSGPGYYLDVYSDTKYAFMSTGGHTGQYWKMIDVNNLVLAGGTVEVNTATTPPATSAPTSNPPTITSTNTNPPTITNTNTNSSQTTKLSVGLGIPLAILLLAALIFAFVTYRRRRNSARGGIQPVPIGGREDVDGVLVRRHELN